MFIKQMVTLGISLLIVVACGNVGFFGMNKESGDYSSVTLKITFPESLHKELAYINSNDGRVNNPNYIVELAVSLNYFISTVGGKTPETLPVKTYDEITTEGGVSIDVPSDTTLIEIIGKNNELLTILFGRGNVVEENGRLIAIITLEDGQGDDLFRIASENEEAGLNNGFPAIDEVEISFDILLDSQPFFKSVIVDKNLEERVLTIKAIACDQERSDENRVNVSGSGFKDAYYQLRSKSHIANPDDPRCDNFTIKYWLIAPIPDDERSPYIRVADRNDSSSFAIFNPDLAN